MRPITSKENVMANKYSKSNISTKAQEEKKIQVYKEEKSSLNKGARIMAIVMIVALVVTFCLMTGLSFFD